MATIINKRTPEIMASIRPRGITFVSVNTRGLYFPKTTAHIMGARKGNFVHFMNEGRRWSFYVNDDPDGFSLNQNKNGYDVANRTLADMFLHSTKSKIGDRFYIAITKSTHQDNTIFEIMTDDTIDVIMKKQQDLKSLRHEALMTYYKGNNK